MEYRVRLAFHIVRDVDGNGGTTIEELHRAIKILNADFNPTIIFDIVGVDDIISTSAKNYFVDNAYKLSTGAPLFTSLVKEKFVPNALNIYLGPSTNLNDGGVASKSRLACTVGGSRVDLAGTPAKYMVTSRAISHEVGHLLNLLHTFDSSFGVGTVNGQNCSTTGDQVCDTPADNGFDYRSVLSQNCTWNNTTERDVNNQLFQPSTTNIMAYTHLRCMSNFTAGQLRRMYDYCLNDPIVKPAVDWYAINWGGNCGQSSSSLKTIIKTGELDFKVFPNPATEFLSVHFMSNSGETELQITDIMGKSLYKKSLGRTTKQDVHDIDFNLFPKGIHIMTVRNELEKRSTKIIIQ
jgi:hypothetical protein